jgi:hypothetical protein
MSLYQILNFWASECCSRIIRPVQSGRNKTKAMFSGRNSVTFYLDISISISDCGNTVLK